MCRGLGPTPWLATQALHFVGDGVQVEFSSVNLFLLSSIWIELHTNISMDGPNEGPRGASALPGPLNFLLNVPQVPSEKVR